MFRQPKQQAFVWHLFLIFATAKAVTCILRLNITVIKTDNNTIHILNQSRGRRVNNEQIHKIQQILPPSHNLLSHHHSPNHMGNHRHNRLCRVNHSHNQPILRPNRHSRSRHLGVKLLVRRRRPPDRTTQSINFARHFFLSKSGCRYPGAVPLLGSRSKSLANTCLKPKAPCLPKEFF
jgi:hypothetical protein